MIKAGDLYVSLWTGVLLLFCALVGSFRWLMLSYAVLAVHELAHYVVAKRLKIACRGLVIQPFGVTLRLMDNRVSEPFYEVILCAAGPLANLSAAACLYLTCDLANADVHYLFVSNLSIAAVNLLPILPLDGGRILKAYLTARLGLVRALKITQTVTWFFVLFVGLCALCMLWNNRFNVSLMVLVSFLLFNMSAEKQSNAYLVMRQTAEYKQKLSAQKIMYVRNLAAQTDTPAAQVVARFSYDKYHIVHLFDAKQHPVGHLTETQILDALICGGGKMRLGEIK